MVGALLSRLWDRISTDTSHKRLLATGLVVLMLVLAGCGGNSNGGETTNASDMTPDETQVGTAGTESGDADIGPETNTDDRSTAASVMSPSNDDSGLTVSVIPSTANATNVTLLARATVDEALASEGIENVTVDTGGGLTFNNMTVSDVDTAGIDEGGALPGNQTSESLAANVEQDIRLTNDGQTLTIPFDGNESIESGDEIIAVIDGGVATNAPGNYSFSLAVDGGSPQTDRYNVTSS